MDAQNKTLPAKLVPQADRLERVIELVRAYAGEGEHGLDNWNERDAHYYAQAARILALLDANDIPTALGHNAAAQSGDALTSALIQAFETSEIGRRWVAWSGVHCLRQVDPTSACEFLNQTTDLAGSTAVRRGAVLGRWHEELFADAAAAVKATSDPSLPDIVASLLDQPVDHPDLPTRMVNWVENHSIRSYRELVAFGLDELLSQRNLGRKTVRETKELVERFTGMAWDDLRSGNAPAEPDEAIPLEKLSWAQLAARMPPCVRDLPLDKVKLPTRMKNHAAANGLCTVWDIAAIPQQKLASEPNLGRKSIVGTRVVFVDLIRNPPSEVVPPSLDDYPSFWELWRAQLARLKAIERMVVTLRSGYSGESRTLAEVGDLLGFTRERARQLEARAITELHSDRWWLDATRTSLEQALGEGLVSFDDLQQDPWWAGLTDHELAFSYFLVRLLDADLHIVEVDGDRFLSAANEQQVDQAWRGLCDDVANLVFPVELEEIKRITGQHASLLGSGFERLFWTRLRDHLRTENSEDQVYGFGSTRAAEVIAFLRSCRQPVKMMDLWAMFGRFHPPDELLYVERGVVTLPECVPDFNKWMKRLVPLCVAIMRDDERERQWSAVELLDELRQSARLPDWLGHWHLAGMLKRSEEVNYLGRLRVALPEHGASEERIHIEPLLLRLLSETSQPVPIQDLLAAAQEHISIPELTYTMMVKRPPFVQVDEQRIGLIERDVPGGAEAIAMFEDALAEALGQRQSGMSPTVLTHFLGGISDTHKKWSWWMARSILRGDDRFRLSQSGSVGLSEWDDVRVPTRAELLLACLNEDNDRTSVAKIQGRITELYGRCPSRTQVGLLANQLGARMSGPVVSRIEAQSDDGSIIERLQGIPTEAAPILRDLLAERPIALDTLRDSVEQHLADIQDAARDNEFIDLEEARELATKCLELLDLVEGDEGGSERRQLIQAAARYFAMSDDAESDFCLGGLDDDLAVVGAISGLIAAEPLPSREASDSPEAELSDNSEASAIRIPGRSESSLTEGDVPFVLTSGTAAGDPSNSFPILELAEAAIRGEGATPIAWCQPGCRRDPSNWLFVAAVATHRTDGPKQSWCLFQWLRNTPPVGRWLLVRTPGVVAPETGSEYCVRYWKQEETSIQLKLREGVEPLLLPDAVHLVPVAELVETLSRDERTGRFTSRVLHRLPSPGERTATRSTTILSASYDPVEQTMDLEFRDRTVHRYFDVPNAVFSDLLIAGRTGAFFQKNVRGKYRSERLHDDTAPPPTPLVCGVPALKTRSNSSGQRRRRVGGRGGRWGSPEDQ